MGLDTVEIIMRTEEVSGISLPDSDCAKVRTVRDLYRLVLDKLSLLYLSAQKTEASALASSRFQPPIRRFLHKTIEFPIRPDPATTPWNAPEVWMTLKPSFRINYKSNRKRSWSTSRSSKTSAVTR